jgi:uncharacterized Fe-S radical SAM superfamily protein PflX
MLAHCNFCPWNCRVDRMAGTKFGACKLASGSRVSSHFHHDHSWRHARELGLKFETATFES